MGSKSILLLGIVIVFLINVLAVHDYVNNHYYSVQTKQDLKPIVIKKEKKHILPPVKKLKRKKTDEELAKYKAYYKSNQIKEQNYTKELLKQQNLKAEKDKKLQKEKIKKIKTNIVDKKVEKEKKDELELKALMSLTFDINQPYKRRSKIIKKLVSKTDKNKNIVIIIYQYSLKIQDYLKNIKDDLVELGLDIDDISTIYKKDKNRKNKIKLLLVKKD